MSEALPGGHVDKSFKSTIVHCKVSQSQLKSKANYDPLARNPMYAQAELSDELWEMNFLTTSVHSRF
jgi:hypothetical protein